MATETGVLHILIGTYDLLPFCNLDGQMARRRSDATTSKTKMIVRRFVMRSPRYSSRSLSKWITMVCCWLG